jgi:lipid II:glycine glycyltransferase (peptidoglycan interpeptide bridge formation enzyme)
MEVKENLDPKVWEDFIARNQSWNFLQSRWWGEILKNEQRDVKFWEIWRNKKMQGVVLLEKKKMARGGFFFLESLWGPVWSNKLTSAVKSELLRDLYEQLLKNEKVIFWRLSPPAGVIITPWTLKSGYYLEAGDLRPGFSWEFFPTLAHTRPPRKTLYIDLELSLEDIMARMKPKTRYNINLAKRKNIKIKWNRGDQALEKFWKLNQITAKRNNFHSHAHDHYLNILKTKSIGPRNRAEIAIAFNGSKPISANLVLFYNKSVYYLHGASGNEERNTMSTYLLHAATIERAKEEGFEVYDFWGTDEKKWPGVTRFKEGFGGNPKYYPTIYEIPLNNLYYKLYRLYRKIR